MTKKDYLENIKTWLSIYRSISAPDLSSDRPDEFTEKWNKGMLRVVASLPVIDDIKGTPIEKHMKKAIEDGNSKDPAKLDDICVLLAEVERYMEERLLH